MRALLIGCIAMAIPAPLMSAAAPDFSGRWVVEAPAQGAAPGRGAATGGRGDMGSGWGSAVTIAQTARQLTVEIAFFGRGDMQPPLRFIYSLEGSETTNSVMMGRGVQRQTSKTAWEGETLVITTTHTFTDPSTGKSIPAEVKQKLSLESPSRLIVETFRAGVLDGPSSTTRTVYTKAADR